jgi:hypothetical protein
VQGGCLDGDALNQGSTLRGGPTSYIATTNAALKHMFCVFVPANNPASSRGWGEAVWAVWAEAGTCLSALAHADEDLHAVEARAG